MTLARIFLILSVVNFTLADLAKSRAMLDAHADWMKMAGDMSKASEKWHKPLDELSEPSTKWSTAMHAHSESMDASSDDSVTGPKADTPPDSATDDGKKFLNEEWKEETKEDMVSAVISTAVTTLASEFVDEITGPADPGSSTVGRDLITRAFGVFRTLNDHRQEDLVLQFLASLRDEDLRFLSMLSRRTLESLD